MSVIGHKNQIRERIQEIEKLDLSKLYPNNTNIELWNNKSNAEIEVFVKNIFKILQGLKDNIDLLDSVDFRYVSQINNFLNDIQNKFNQLIKLEEDKITTHHHACLNSLNELNNILRSSALYTEIKLVPKLKDKLDILNEITPLSTNLLDNSESLKNAITQAFEWLKNKSKIDEETIKGQATAFLDRANAHKIGGERTRFKFFKWYIPDYSIDYWLLLTLVFASIVGYFTYQFIDEAGTDISLGKALLKISSLLVPAYLTAFSANQYLYHKKMYEAYIFKFASLHTMNNLINTQKPEFQEKILAKGLNVLFSEPAIKEDGGKFDKQIISELLGMLKSQIK